MAIFIFPRDSEGKPTFDRADKQIEFKTGVGHQRITATFDIDKILVNGVVDF